MQWLGPFVTIVGLLIVGGYYSYQLFLYLFALDFMPYPVRMALPVVVVGVLMSVLSTLWENIKKNRRERFREMEEQFTEHPRERSYIPTPLSGLDD
jgi:hypothetical protein